MKSFKAGGSGLARRRILVLAAIGGMCFRTGAASAQDAMLLANPVSSDWNTAANWSPATVPSGTAIFGPSSVTSITFSANTAIGTLQFNSDAPAFTFGGPFSNNASLTVNGRGIVNNLVPRPTISGGFFLSFVNGSTAGNAILRGSSFNRLSFANTSSAASAAISSYNVINFLDSSTAGMANIENAGFFGSSTFFSSSSSADRATITNIGRGANTIFGDTSTAANATITSDGRFASTEFDGTSTAANATITNNNLAGLFFRGSSTAGNATIINDRGIVGFSGKSSAGNATITTDNSGDVFIINFPVLHLGTFFSENSTGGSARLITNALGTVDISGRSAEPLGTASLGFNIAIIMNKFSIGVDLGGTNLRIAAVDDQGALVEKVTLGTKVSLGRDHVIDDMCDAIQHLTDKYKSSAPLLGIGIGVPGIIDMQTGLLRESPNLPGWAEYPVRAEIERRLKTIVILENDANVAALGEKWLGAAKDYSDVAMLTLGTGVGGGLVMGGLIWRGANGMAGSLGTSPSNRTDTRAVAEILDASSNTLRRRRWFGWRGKRSRKIPRRRWPAHRTLIRSSARNRFTTSPFKAMRMRGIFSITLADVWASYFRRW